MRQCIVSVHSLIQTAEPESLPSSGEADTIDLKPKHGHIRLNIQNNMKT